MGDEEQALPHGEEGELDLQSRQHGATAGTAPADVTGISPKLENCVDTVPNEDGVVQTITRRKRSRLRARKATNYLADKTAGATPSSFLAEERACRPTLSIQGHGSPERAHTSMVTSLGSMPAAGARGRGTASRNAGSDGQDHKPDVPGHGSVEDGRSPDEVVGQSFTCQGKRVKEIVKLVCVKQEKEVDYPTSDQRSGGGSSTVRLPRTGLGAIARGFILSEVVEEPGAGMRHVTDDGSSQGTQSLHSGSTALASVESDSFANEHLAASSCKTAHNRVGEANSAAESGRAVSSNHDDGGQKNIPSPLQVGRLKCSRRSGEENQPDEGQEAPSVAERNQPGRLDTNALQTCATKVSRLTVEEVETSVAPAPSVRNAGCLSAPGAGLSRTEEALIYEALTPTSPCLPPGFEGGFASMVSGQDSTPCKDVVHVCSKEDEGRALPQSSKEKLSPANPGLQTTACSSNGKEHLGGNGSQTDSDDVPLSGKADNSPPYGSATMSGVHYASNLHGVSPATPHAVPPRPTTCLSVRNASGLFLCQFFASQLIDTRWLISPFDTAVLAFRP